MTRTQVIFTSIVTQSWVKLTEEGNANRNIGNLCILNASIAIIY